MGEEGLEPPTSCV